MYPRLRTFRESLGMTQEEFGKSLNIAKSTYNNYETGVRDPKSDFWIAVAKKYKVTIDYLMGFSDDPRQAPESSNALSTIEQDHIKKYRFLDPYGKEAVDGVLDVEYRRCTAPAPQEQPEADNVIYITKCFPRPMSAGTGTEAGDDEPEELELTKRPPRGTSYVAPVSGDSMEPTYYDGDRLFIRAQDEIEPGQIGVFFMDGQQWVKELGDGELISHNPDYDPIPMREDIRCQGLVLGVCDDSYFE